MKENDLAKIKSWHKLAARANSLEEFLGEIQKEGV